MKGPNQNVRVRQVKLLALPPSSNSDAIVPVEVAHMQSCEQEALKLFRLLTSQVSGRAVAFSEQVGRACKESLFSLASFQVAQCPLQPLCAFRHSLTSLHVPFTPMYSMLPFMLDTVPEVLAAHAPYHSQ